MFKWCRQRVAAFSFGYLAVQFYNTAQQECSDEQGHFDFKKMPQPLQQHKSWLPHFLSTPPPPVPVARPSDDLRYLIVEYDVASAVFMSMLIMASGLSGIAGAGAAVILECSEDGPRVYQELMGNVEQAQREGKVAIGAGGGGSNKK